MTDRLAWGDPEHTWAFEWNAETPVHLAEIRLGERSFALHRVPFVEILTADHGHLPASGRLAHTELGSQLRYTAHELAGGEGDDASRLVIRQATPGVEAVIRLEHLGGTGAIRASVSVTATGDEPLVLRSVTSWSAGFTVEPDGEQRDAAVGHGASDRLDGWTRIAGVSDWLGEGRWSKAPLRGPDFPELAEHLTGHDPRGAWAATSDGTWSTGADLPVAAVESGRHGLALAWQIEHNGPWRWEIGEDTDGGYVSLSGPTESDAAWTHVVAPGETFTTVAATVAVGTGFEHALAALTDFRRLARRPHPDNAAMPVVFNDYMNTLDGDPTTEKLLPLIAAAAEVGAEVFCIDAGWYDDSGHWWDTVGEWLPSTTRFPGGLGEVVDAIRSAGMVPGLWLEPEVVGVRSPIADALPPEAFLLRHGRRIVEHHRYHLDLRHPAAVAHLDGVVDRLVADFGIGFFKFDYNINPGIGTDHDADSPGDGLLEHNRAHLAWLDALLDRHPGLVIENCASGAMRMDFAMLSRLAMQSTSDQQDFVRYPPIAAAAPISMLPEQAASWAYPQPDMNAEEIAFCLVTGLLGRYYVSGYLNRMTAEQRALVAEAVATAKAIRAEIASGHAHWPLGLPGWTDAWIALGLRGERGDLVSLWRRDGEDAVTLHLPHLAGRDLAIEPVFPSALPAWRTSWNAASGTLAVYADDSPVAARTIRLVAGAHRRTEAPASPTAID